MSGYSFALNHSWRIRGQQLAHLRHTWGDAYDIGWDEEWVARRRDDKGTIFAATASGLEETLKLDLSIQPMSAAIRRAAEEWWLK